MVGKEVVRGRGDKNRKTSTIGEWCVKQIWQRCINWWAVPTDWGNKDNLFENSGGVVGRSEAHGYCKRVANKREIICLVWS